MTHYLILESIWLISLSLFPYMHKYDSSFIISPMDMAILHAKLVWLSVATITTSFSIWLRLSIETLNQYSQNESWLRLSIETLNHPPKTTIVSSPSLFVTVTNEDRDWPVYLKGFRFYFKRVVLAPSHVSRRLFECDKRLEWVNHSPVGDKWVMTDPHEPLKFKINNPLSRIRHRKSATRGRTFQH